MFERLTDRARKVMALANQEAQRFNHDYIGSEHILLGLIKEGSGVGAQVLKNLDIDLRKVRIEVEKQVKAGPDMVTMGALPQTPRAKKVLEYATEEANDLNHAYAGTEHLLLGLIREQDGVASHVLIALGLKLETVREAVMNILGLGVDLDISNSGKWDTIDPDERALIGQLLGIDKLEEQIEFISIQKDEAVKDADYEKAAELRTVADRLRSEKERILVDYQSGKISLPSIQSRIERCAIRARPTQGIVVRSEFIDDIVEQVIKGGLLFLNAPKGCGASYLINAIADRLRALPEYSKRRQLYLPDFRVILNSRKRSEAEEAINILFDSLRHGASFVLAFPDLHFLADVRCVEKSLSDQIIQQLSETIDGIGSVLATITPEGIIAMRKCWPGLISRAQIIDVPEPTQDEIQIILEDHMDRAAKPYNVKAGEGFVTAVIENASQFEIDSPLVEPGRSLLLLKRVLEQALLKHNAAVAKHVKQPESETQFALKQRVKRYIDDDRITDAMKGLRTLEKIENTNLRSSRSKRQPLVEISGDIVKQFMGEHNAARKQTTV